MATSPGLAGSVRTVALVLAHSATGGGCAAGTTGAGRGCWPIRSTAAGVAAPTMKADWDFATWLPPSP
jgi:hypothetical protein